MKIKVESLYKKLDFITLYREDIEHLYRLFKDNSTHFDFDVDEFQLDNIEELSELKRRTGKNINFMTRGPFIMSLQISKSLQGARFFIPSFDAQAAGIYTLLREFLVTKQDKFRIIIKKYWLLPLLILSLVISFLFPHLFLNGNFQTRLLKIVLFDGFLMILGWILIFRIPTVIYLEYKKDIPSFLSRNKDQIITGIILTVIAGLLGYFLGSR